MTDKLKQNLTLGSLFSGSGGFELAGLLCGIKPLFSSEIEPFPIRVTTKRMPFIKHLGDINKIDGSKIDPVDIITFGSPCQNLSVAAKDKSGLDGEKSGIFYEAIRVIKEMRDKTNGKYPRYIVWENVRGALFSSKGNDFLRVIKEIIKIKDCKFDVPKPEKWENSGLIMGEDFSVAWRLFDAQYWGVPQRRKRIYLVADFNGQRAGKILFESEGVSGYSAESFRAWQRAAGCTEAGSYKTGRICLNDQGGSRMDATEDVTCTLRAEARHPPVVLEHHPHDSRIRIIEDNVCQTLTNRMGTGGTLLPPVLQNLGSSVYTSSKQDCHTILNQSVAHKTCATDWKDPPIVYYEPYYIIRRITPTECARLQGFPDWWCSELETEEPTKEDIEFWMNVFEDHRRVVTKAKRKKSEKQIIKWLKNPYSDSAQYKMWGNGIALPNALFVLAGIVWASNLSDSD